MGIKLLALFIFLILVTLTGYGVWNIYTGQVKMRESVRGTTIITNEKNSRDLHELLTEHTSLLNIHLGYVYDGDDTKITKDQLNYNTQKIGQVIEEIGSKEDSATFISLFKKQVTEYENYTVSLKAKDPHAIDAAKKELEKNAVDFGKLMNKLSPSISEKRGEELMLEDIALTLAIVDANAQNDSGKKMVLLKDANLHANLFADEWAKSIEIEGNL